jgi:hypothetical protein
MWTHNRGLMSEQTPQPDNPRAFFQDVCDRSPMRNRGMIALTLKDDIESARRFFAGYVEEFAANPLPIRISEENRDPERLARASILHVIRVGFEAEERRPPTDEEIDERLGAYKEIFAEREEQADN